MHRIGDTYLLGSSDCSAPKPERVHGMARASTASPMRKLPLTLNTLIDQQEYLGYFSLSDFSLRPQLLRKFDSQVIIDELRQCLPNFVLNNAFVATLLTITFIKARYAEFKELWDLVILKAENWLKRQVENEELLNECWQITQKHLRSESTIEPATAPSDVENTNTNTNTNPKSTLDGISEDLVEADVARDNKRQRRLNPAEKSL